MTKVLFETDIPTPGGFQNAVDWLYRDEANPSEEQCWGDAHHTGVHGSWVVETIPDTDPRSVSFRYLESTRIAYFADPGVTNEIVAAWSEQVETPLVVTVAPYTP